MDNDILNKIEVIKQEFKSEKSDLEIAEKLKLTEGAVKGVRSLLGLTKGRGVRQSIFETSRKVGRVKDSDSLFVSTFSIPVKYVEQMGLNQRDTYKVVATAGRMQMTLRFERQ